MPIQGQGCHSLAIWLDCRIEILLPIILMPPPARNHINASIILACSHKLLATATW